MELIKTSAKVRRLDPSPDAVALFDVLLIAVMLTLTSSKFILSPGMGVDLSSEALPTMQNAEEMLSQDNMSVITAGGKSMLIFEGKIFSSKTLETHLAQTKSPMRSKATLLIKADKNIDSQTLIDICQAAKEGGFGRVQIAAKPMQSDK